MADLERVRRELMAAGVDVAGVDPDPLVEVQRGVGHAWDVGIFNANAMALATSSPDGDPAVRNVLMQGVDDGALTFYTNYDSDKARHLRANPRAEAVFSWLAIERQVRVHGRVRPLDDARSDAYWAGRPRQSQLSATVSAQSRPIGSRSELEQRVAALDAELGDRPVPRPATWGGYGLDPDRVELWQGRPNRLHDRVVYERVDGAWARARLQP